MTDLELCMEYQKTGNDKIFMEIFSKCNISHDIMSKKINNYSAKFHYYDYMELEDCSQDLYERLIKSILKLDPNKVKNRDTFKISTFIAWEFQYYFNNFFRKKRKTIFEKMPENFDKSFVDHNFLEIEDLEIIEKFYDTLNKMRKKILYLVLCGKKSSEISEKLKTSTSNVNMYRAEIRREFQKFVKKG